MPYWTAGKINPKLLYRFNVDRIAFEYIENFLFSIKYMKESAIFYFPTFEEFVSERGHLTIPSRHINYSSPVESSWRLLAIEIEDTLEKGTTRHLKELYRFYKAWYVDEVENSELQRILGYSERWTLYKRDIYRINLVTLVERKTLIVPPECFRYQKIATPKP